MIPQLSPNKLHLSQKPRKITPPPTSTLSIAPKPVRMSNLPTTDDVTQDDDDAIDLTIDEGESEPRETTPVRKSPSRSKRGSVSPSKSASKPTKDIMDLDSKKVKVHSGAVGEMNDRISPLKTAKTGSKTRTGRATATSKQTKGAAATCTASSALKIAQETGRGPVLGIPSVSEIFGVPVQAQMQRVSPAAPGVGVTMGARHILPGQVSLSSKNYRIFICKR